MRKLTLRAGVALAEGGRLPDALVRWGIRRLCRRRLLEERASQPDLPALVETLRASPVAVAAERANQQHYEVPPAFFEAVLGPRLKYSCGWFGPGVEDLGAAEEAMLALTCERAQIEDGMRILDLGCGWGSLALWVAERHPRAQVLAVSNSKDQREAILARCARRGLRNVEAITADVNTFAPDPSLRFDRVVSIEMFEHVRNWGLLLGRIRRWLAPDGKLFLHYFCHRELAYLYEDRGQGDWMARHFFTGGMMPAQDLIRAFADDLRVEESWRVDGCHYARTCNAWLANLDRARPRVLRLFEKVYGSAAPAWLVRWRLFFLACAELFAFDGGREWFVAHVRLVPTGAGEEHCSEGPRETGGRARPPAGNARRRAHASRRDTPGAALGPAQCPPRLRRPGCSKWGWGPHEAGSLRRNATQRRRPPRSRGSGTWPRRAGPRTRSARPVQRRGREPRGERAMIAELRITPVGNRAEFARLVGEAVRLVAESPLQYQVNAMGTTLEGELGAMLDLVRRCHQELRKHCERLLIELSIDDRGGAQGELVRSLERVRELRLGVPLERFVCEPQREL